MKRILLISLLICAISFCAFPNDNITTVIPTNTGPTNYVLYPTTNMFNFLKLETTSGRIWQVQYSIDNMDNEFETPLNSIWLSFDNTPGRFALYPTQNMWTFLLLDTITGDLWHVQWSLKENNSGIIPIKRH